MLGFISEAGAAGSGVLQDRELEAGRSDLAFPRAWSLPPPPGLLLEASVPEAPPHCSVTRSQGAGWCPRGPGVSSPGSEHRAPAWDTAAGTLS